MAVNEQGLFQGATFLLLVGNPPASVLPGIANADTPSSSQTAADAVAKEVVELVEPLPMVEAAIPAADGPQHVISMESWKEHEGTYRNIDNEHFQIVFL